MAAAPSSTDANKNGKPTAPLKELRTSRADPERPELPALRFWLLTVGLCLGLFLSFIDSSIVATSLFSIGVEFNDLESINWVALAYTLSHLGCAVLLARISDIIGRRNAFISAFIIFFAFSIGCGFAQNLNQLIACRAIQGLGGSGLYSITIIILLEVSPERLKGFLASVVGIVVAVSGVLGPVLGGILTHYSSWRWVFWINGPIGAAAVILFYLTWPRSEYLPVNIEQRSWRELDYLGSTLLIAAAVLVTFSFQNARGEEIWTRAIFLAPLLVGVGCWGLLIAWEIFVDDRWGDAVAAAFPMRLMRNRVYGAAILNTICLGFPFIMLVYAFPLRLQAINGKSSLTAGVMLLPMLGTSALGSVLSGAINRSKDRICETLVVSSGLVSLGCGLLSTLSASYGVEAKALGFLVFVGLGFGMSAAASTMLADLYSSIRDHSVAQGMIAQVRLLGGSIGIAASSAILGVTFRTQLAGLLDPQALYAFENSKGLVSEDQLNAIRQAYSNAFNEDMRVCATVAGVGIILALGTGSRNRPTLQERSAQNYKEEVERSKTAQAQQSESMAGN